MWQQRFLRFAQRLLGRQPEQRPAAASPANAAMDEWLQRWEEEQARRREEREQRRAARTTADRVYFGEEVWGASAAQRNAGPDALKLQAANLPVLLSEADLAAWLGISLGRLRWFTHDKPADAVWHYVRYRVPKRSGGERVILAPKSELKSLQRKVLRELLTSVPAAPAAHGFVPERSIVTNARPHAGKAIVLNLDLQDFFPSITFPRVRGLLIELGYSAAVAAALALLCTEYEREAFDRDDRRYFISIGPRHLVQGAPTSPALANLVARRLDRRLAGLAAGHGFTYTRYADDLTFSGDDLSTALRILDVAQRIVGDEGFAINTSKTRLFRRSGKQVVTGLVVNDQVSTPRHLRRRLRAILHNAEQTGLDAQNRAGRAHFRAYLAGLIGFVEAAHPRHAERLKDRLQRL